LEEVRFPVQVAPQSLYQPILPNWQFNLLSVNLGASTDAKVEQAVITRVGSYGKQIGHLAEALEVIIHRSKLLDTDLTQKERDALQVFLGDVSAIRRVKGNP
jgi:hypothetical protein